MKLVTAIIQPFMIDRLARALFKAPISGYTVTESQGSAKPDMSNPQYLVPRSKVEIVIREEHVEELINIILHAVGTHQDGDGLLTWQESQIGSSPTDAAEAPLMIDFETGQPGTNAWRIVWQAFTNRNFTYSILASTNPAQGGFVVFTNVVAAPPVMTSPPLPPDLRSCISLRSSGTFM